MPAPATTILDFLRPLEVCNVSSKGRVRGETSDVKRAQKSTRTVFPQARLRALKTRLGRSRLKFWRGAWVLTRSPFDDSRTRPPAPRLAAPLERAEVRIAGLGADIFALRQPERQEARSRPPRRRRIHPHLHYRAYDRARQRARWRRGHRSRCHTTSLSVAQSTALYVEADAASERREAAFAAVISAT
jgi:hypothetical protein